MLFEKTMKMPKINEKVAKKWKASKEQNSSLKAELAEVQKLEDENNRLADKLTAESQKYVLFDSNMKTLKQRILI